MKMNTPLFAGFAAALLAMPAIAQTAAPAAPAQQGMAAGPEARGKAPPRGWRKGQHAGGGMFRNLSPEGRKLMVEAMRPLADPQQRAQVKAARDRVNQLLVADRLDAAALGRAMDEERRLVDAQHARRQQALLGALQKMSAEDRKAFAASSRMGRERMDDMMRRYRAGNGPTRATPPGTN